MPWSEDEQFGEHLYSDFEATQQDLSARSHASMMRQTSDPSPPPAQTSSLPAPALQLPQTPEMEARAQSEASSRQASGEASPPAEAQAEPSQSSSKSSQPQPHPQQPQQPEQQLSAKSRQSSEGSEYTEEMYSESFEEEDESQGTPALVASLGAASTPLAAQLLSLGSLSPDASFHSVASGQRPRSAQRKRPSSAGSLRQRQPLQAASIAEADMGSAGATQSADACAAASGGGLRTKLAGAVLPSGPRLHDAVPRHYKSSAWSLASQGAAMQPGDYRSDLEETSARETQEAPRRSAATFASHAAVLNYPSLASRAELEQAAESILVGRLAEKFVKSRGTAALRQQQRLAYKEMLQQVAWTALEPASAQELALLLSKRWLAPVSSTEALRAFRRCVHSVLTEEYILDVVEQHMSRHFGAHLSEETL